MKIALTTLGCKVNTYETEAVWELLDRRGYTRVEPNEWADVYLINTCLVTNTGEAKSRQMIRHPLKINPNAVLVVMGCLAELKPESIANIENVKIIVGTKDRDRIPDLLDDYFSKGFCHREVQHLENEEPYDNLTLSAFSSQQRAFLKIEDGCNNFCSYCIIPYARGRVRSKAKESVLNEARILAKKHPEIILTGIHTGGYGSDFSDYGFPDLLEDLDRIPEIKRLRISSIEINELTDRVIGIIASSHQICSHLHIPLQSGTDRILRLMNRKYDTESFRNRLNSLRKAIPELAITTDVIVGFPGETDADFRETCEYVREIGFSELHVFPFSPRSGTVASQLPGMVSGLIKKERVATLIAIGNTLAKQAIHRQLGQILHVVVEREHQGLLQGHSRNYVQLVFPGKIELIGKEVAVRLIAEDYPMSRGMLIE
jgi:threonylcarbamoyladenosine tRNA methylthiotransferase MtaB